MGVVMDLVAPGRVGAYAPGHDYWYEPRGMASSAGVRVSAETSLRTSTVYACTSLLSEVTASLPLWVYRRIDDDRRERAGEHRVSRLLHDRPNSWQSAVDFRTMLGMHQLLKGNGYAFKKRGYDGQVEELIPLEPDNVRVEVASDRTLRYRVREQVGVEQTYLPEEIFHLRGLTLNGYTGVSVIEYARQTIGLALATEEYAARFFGSGAALRGVIEAPFAMEQDQVDRLRAQFTETYTGLSNSHKTAILEGGAKFSSVSIGPEDSQLIEQMEARAEDLCRWFRIPPHMVGLTSKSTSWGSGVEQMSIGFVVYTLVPWIRRWEQAIDRDLVTEEDYFASVTVDGLLRGDTKSRYEAYQIAVGGPAPWMTRQEVRRLENLEPLDGLDSVLQPLNMGSVGDAESARLGARTRQAPEKAATALGKLAVFARDAAARVIRKEIGALSREAQRAADDPAGWVAAVDGFYAEHAAYVAEALHIPRAQASWYVAEQAAHLKARGASVMEDWERTRVPDLVGLALDAAEVAA